MCSYYLTHQRGGGLADIGGLYRAPVFIQRGRGVGSFFAGLWKYIAPLAVSGLKTIGKQSLKTGADVLSDLAEGKNLKSTLREHSHQAAKDLAKRGINKLRTLHEEQSGRGVLSHTLGSIKEGHLRRSMLVGQVKRKRKARSTTSTITRKKRRVRSKTSQSGGRRKKKTQRKKRSTAKKRGKSSRSIDIFDI